MPGGGEGGVGGEGLGVVPMAHPAVCRTVPSESPVSGWLTELDNRGGSRIPGKPAWAQEAVCGGRE